MCDHRPSPLRPAPSATPPYNRPPSNRRTTVNFASLDLARFEIIRYGGGGGNGGRRKKERGNRIDAYFYQGWGEDFISRDTKGRCVDGSIRKGGERAQGVRRQVDNSPSLSGPWIRVGEVLSVERDGRRGT